VPAAPEPDALGSDGTEGAEPQPAKAKARQASPYMAAKRQRLPD
jgi:hypothetical protein